MAEDIEHARLSIITATPVFHPDDDDDYVDDDTQNHRRLSQNHRPLSIITANFHSNHNDRQNHRPLSIITDDEEDYVDDDTQSHRPLSIITTTPAFHRYDDDDYVDDNAQNQRPLSQNHRPLSIISGNFHSEDNDRQNRRPLSIITDDEEGYADDDRENHRPLSIITRTRSFNDEDFDGEDDDRPTTLTPEIEDLRLQLPSLVFEDTPEEVISMMDQVLLLPDETVHFLNELFDELLHNNRGSDDDEIISLINSYTDYLHRIGRGGISTTINSNINHGFSEEIISQYIKISSWEEDDHHHHQEDCEEICVICQDEYEGQDMIGTLKCKHEYHLDCIKRWLMVKDSCPLCKCNTK